MFGMSSEEFWEEDPQLYWAYRTFYLKQKEEEIELMRHSSWLQGELNYVGFKIALSKLFKNNNTEFPKFEEIFPVEKPKKLSKNDVNMRVQEEFNAWARF